ncbi:ATP-binding protein [Nostoc sp. 'Peltigera membranacea cyanobiont' 232]|uniref:ATP-binding protein n=1 Tax=Nostoc sp. 'Peltigera membranacea cyanobiont' 232 TaxID=2014531 RepID=UPI000B958410|nr:HAMP domain-containing sensor histidine kinase [Nostoc sp. 'Peltigera membranacea cyanobiont' 232]OYE02668.1 ATP-binding protein [Nostoc sp. 'Peltigera membranacea cyanobiont' 232]
MSGKILVIGRRRNQVVASVLDSLQQSNYSVVTKSAIPDNKEGIDLILDVTLKPISVRSEGLPAIKLVQSADDLCIPDFDDFVVYPFSSFELLKRVDLCLLRQSDRFCRLPQYLEMVSHDVYHPLRTVNFVLGLTRAGNYGNSLEQLDSVLETCCSTITVTLGVLADLKSQLSQEPVGNIEYINIASLLHSIHAQFLNSAIAQNINFSILVEPLAADACLYANYNHLWRMVCNLIVNAFRYSPGGGSVAIKLDTQGGRFLRLAVQDTGVGITRVQLEQLNIDLGISQCIGISGSAFSEPNYLFEECCANGGDSMNAQQSSTLQEELHPTRISVLNSRRCKQEREIRELGSLAGDGTFTLDATGSHVACAGLGLRTVKYVADCYQASVSVFSQVGEGSTFVIIFNLEANFQCYSQDKYLLENNTVS